MSACHRSGSVNVDSGMGSTSTCAPAGSRRAVNVCRPPGRHAGLDPAGSGRGTIGAIATSAASAIAQRTRA